MCDLIVNHSDSKLIRSTITFVNYEEALKFMAIMAMKLRTPNHFLIVSCETGEVLMDSDDEED